MVPHPQIRHVRYQNYLGENPLKMYNFFLSVILYTKKFDNSLQNICNVLDTRYGTLLAGRCVCVVDKYVMFYDT